MTHNVLKKYFRQLDRLQKIIFSCYIKRDYAQNQLYYEKKIHLEKMNLFKIVCNIRKHIPSLCYLFQDNGRGVCLYEIVLSLNTLKLRISDHATFEVCQRELEGITNSISAVLDDVSRGRDCVNSLSNVLQSIERFSEVYQSTLRVITAEPTIFLFFIQDLIDFNETLEKFFVAPTAQQPELAMPFSTARTKKINWLHLLSMTLAVIISLVAAHYLGFFGMYLIPLVALLVMQTSVASAFDQGVWRVFLLAIFATVLAISIHSMPFLYQVMHDIGIGAVIGIAANILIFPRRADKEFRLAMVDVIHCYERYFINTMSQLTQAEVPSVAPTKTDLDMQLLSLPGWVYQRGFDTSLRSGHRFFLMTVEQISDVLFSMHHLANCSLEQALIEQLQSSFDRCAIRVQEFFSGLVTLLELKKLSRPIADFSDELLALEEKFQAVVPLSIELLDVRRDYVYIAAFIYHLTSLRRLLLKLAQALR